MTRGFLSSCRLADESLEPLELRDHHLAWRYQHVAVFVGKSAGQKSLGETQIGSSFLKKQQRSGGESFCPRARRDRLGRRSDERCPEGSRLSPPAEPYMRPPRRQPQQEERNDHDGSSCTHGQTPSRRPPPRVMPEGRLRLGNGQR